MKTAEEYFESTPIGFICRINKQRGYEYRILREDVIVLMENYSNYMKRQRYKKHKLKTK